MLKLSKTKKGYFTKVLLGLLLITFLALGAYIWKFKPSFLATLVDPCASFTESGIYTDTIPGNKVCVEQALRNPYTRFLKKQADSPRLYESYLEGKITNLESQITSLKNDSGNKQTIQPTETVIYQPSQSVNCTSNKIGNYVYTNCR